MLLIAEEFFRDRETKTSWTKSRAATASDVKGDSEQRKESGSKSKGDRMVFRSLWNQREKRGTEGNAGCGCRRREAQATLFGRQGCL